MNWKHLEEMVRDEALLWLHKLTSIFDFTSFQKIWGGFLLFLIEYKGWSSSPNHKGSAAGQNLELKHDIILTFFWCFEPVSHWFLSCNGLFVLGLFSFPVKISLFLSYFLKIPAHRIRLKKKHQQKISRKGLIIHTQWHSSLSGYGLKQDN